MPQLFQSASKKAETKNPSAKTFPQLLQEFKESMHRAFHEDDKIDSFSSTRGLPPAVLKELMSGNPLALLIPKEYGGFGGSIKENITFISAASYESLALSLMLGINNGLFIQPLAKYGQDSVKKKVFNSFLTNSCMGGLMITEPNFGSDALSMLTSFYEKDGFYHLKGKKHWAGLTGMADFWLLTARKRSESGSLMRDIDIFLCDVNAPKQKIKVEEYFENLGLYQIPYGRNNIDVYIPEEQRLIPHTSGVQMLLDLLHRSRFQFPAMGLGFVKRILDEAIIHANTRLVGKKNLFDYDQVQHRLSRLQANYTILSAFCLKSAKIAGIDNDLSGLGLEANITKTITSDIMHEAAQSLLQLVGAKGYKINHFAGRSLVDSRPFQIFEGSNDILYHQIADAVIKRMKTDKQKKVSQFFQQLTPRAIEKLKEILNFELNYPLPQRKLVDFGRVISRIQAMEHVVFLGEKGFRKDLIENAIIVLKQEIANLLDTFHYANDSKVVENYGENSLWFEL
jgi:alkylation response protein AidB-like acyl-CoA dehydrogenase